MPDLSFNSLAAQLPSGAVTASGGDVLISAKAVMGETSVAIGDQKIGELLAKLLEACSQAQDAYNAVYTPKFRSYNPPSAGTPTRNSTTGEYYSTFTYTMSINVPLNNDIATAVETNVSGF